MITQPNPVDSRRRAPAFFALLFGAILVVLFVGAASANNAGAPKSVTPATPTQTPTGCIRAWDVIASPNPDAYGDQMIGLAAIFDADMWAVGIAGSGALIEHWDGAAWTAITATQVLTGGQLYDVSAVSTNDVWAVGRTIRYSPNGQALIVHWDGSQWSIVPNPAQQDSWMLHGVAAVASNDVWAVGGRDDGSGQALTMHWNGAAWAIVPTPAPQSGRYFLTKLAAISTNDIWAVGDTISMHWNGIQWSVVPVPFVGFVFGVAALATNDVWAVSTDSGYSNSTGYIYHWDGTSWALSSSDANKSLYGIAAASANDVWAVGGIGSSGASGTFVKHWDGSTWNVVPSPGNYPAGGRFWDAVTISPDELWAVGDSGNPVHTFTARYANDCPTPITCNTGWNIIHTQNPDPNVNLLYGMDARTPGDIWAVGALGDGRPLVQHWNGSYWSFVPVSSPNPSALTLLRDVKALAADNVWTVGYTYTYSLKSMEMSHTRQKAPLAPATWQTSILHWDGMNWSSVPSPNPGGANGNPRLFGVDGSSANDLWAVGSYTVNNVPQTLILHWNGAAWSLLPGPQGILYDVMALASNNVWAVGSTNEEGAPSQTLIMHWDGSQWNVVPGPSPGSSENYLGAVSAVSASDMWGVGYYLNGVNYGALTLHWNGSQWTQVAAPTSLLTGVSAVASNDVWAVGAGSLAPTITMHWDGTVWTTVPNPNPNPTSAELWDVAAVSSNEVWAVGDVGRPLNTHTLVERYVGTCQTVTPTLTATATATATATNTSTMTATPIATAISTSTSTLTSTASATATATATATNTLAATGTYTPPPPPPPSATIIPATYTPTIPPTSTPTSISTATATTTNTPTSTFTAIPTSIPTSCSLQFTDVSPDNTFYPYVRCLACQSIINGYTCGNPEPCVLPDNNPYFRPNNSVTRGQLAKIVSQAAGFTETVVGQSFEDVAPGSAFYTYTERLALHSVMSGYQCGGPGEPCDAQSRPYFRPSNTATRGQLTKIVSNAAGYNDAIPSGQYTFADVQEGSTYHLYVERLLMHHPGVISGYLCGDAPGEPCDAQSRPYFRPNNTLTRGQTAKVTANTFFPGCSPSAR